MLNFGLYQTVKMIMLPPDRYAVADGTRVTLPSFSSLLLYSLCKPP